MIQSLFRSRLAASSFLLTLPIFQAVAQTAPVAASPSTSVDVNAPGAQPWFVGASQAITRSSNAYRTADSTSDTYSTTSIFGGVDIPLGRQRVFARGSYSLNRYFDQKELNNSSYSVGAGADFATVMNLSGGIDIGLDQQLSAPIVSSSETAEDRRNLARTQRVDGRLLWGGASVVTLEARGGYSHISYADEAYAGSESSRRDAGLTAYYRPGARLRIGVGVRADRTDQPVALRDPITGTTQSNEIDGRHIDLLADYALTGITNIGGRLSHSRQSSSNQLLQSSDFSGLTGAFNISYRATGKLSGNLSLSRDVGTAAFGQTVSVVTLPIDSGTSVTNPSASPTTVLYENNRVTNAASLGVSYAATAKIGVSVGLRYARSTIASTSTVQADAEYSDTSRSASIGASYAVARLVGLGCSASYERRSASLGSSYDYSGTSIGCNASVRWP